VQAAPTLTPALRERFNAAISAAKTLAEIDALEAAMRAGAQAVESLLAASAADAGAAAAAAASATDSAAAPNQDTGDDMET
jgi:hypothetical protein